MALQITSMADIFTIILVFLLKSFSTGIANISPAQGMMLPSVTAKSEALIKEASKLEILPDGVLIDQKPVMKLRNFAHALGEDAEYAEPVYQALQQERAKSRQPASESNLIVLADERTPYSTLKLITASAARAGYVDLQLIVVGAD